MANDKPEIVQPGTNTWPFRLGDKVKDKINGLEGTLVEHIYHMTGCDRFTIELDLKEPGSKPEYYVVEAERMELTKARPELHRDDEVPDIHVLLGDKVSDEISGMEGTVTAIMVPLTGAVRIIIDPGWDTKAKKMGEPHYVDAPFVKVIKPYTPRPKAETKPKEATKKTRGPVRMPSRDRGIGGSRR